MRIDLPMARPKGLATVAALLLAIVCLLTGWHCATAVARVQHQHEQRTAEYAAWCDEYAREFEAWRAEGVDE